MKQRLLISKNWSQVLTFFLIVLGYTSCNDQVESTYTYHAMVPVSMEASTLRSMSVGQVAPREISETGKIYIFGDFLFVNEPHEGIHVINNSNPSNPQNISFIEVPGTVDLAVNDNILYADSYIDLLAFDISNPYNVKMVKRVEDVFMNYYTNPEVGTFMYFKDSVMTSTEPRRNWGGPIFWLETASFANADAGGSYGQGGSMARFTLSSGYLYTVDDYDLRLFDVSEKASPEFVKQINLGWGIETIFPFKDKLFIGSNTGMHIYDVSTPSEPEMLSVYSHFTSCDPVVANDDYAFVTLRSGTFCRQGMNVLEVLDIKDPSNPKLLKSYEMKNPHGLGLSGYNLFVCEGEYGLKSFKVQDVMNLDKNQMQHLENLNAIDLIPGPKSLIVIGNDVICQYDYSNPGQLKLLSCMQIEKQQLY
ncbi:LVIVD repeat-containing protein [Echinicola sp. 20G]|uniref:LVIVD repeat-containing protein n=1 Tax=Echinicola sp. 20G TaxID=2781961 RepID=UPI0019109B3E|nr:hypothetical protein [Echinicola sp. 20G]